MNIPIFLGENTSNIFLTFPSYKGGETNFDTWIGTVIQVLVLRWSKSRESRDIQNLLIACVENDKTDKNL